MTLPRTTLFRSILALGAGAACLAALPASAQHRLRPPITVHFTHNPEDSAATNYRNLLVKVRRVCRSSGPLALSSLADQRICIAQMSDLAVAQVGRPDLMAEHEAAKGAAGRQLAAQ
jgi:hypothetical protein